MKASIRCRIRWAALVVLVGLTASASIQAGTIYVATTGNDTNDGLSWATAKLTVQAGLNAAVSGDQVWVAAGTYVQCITLKAEVALYGGFVGSETDLAQRNWAVNATVLDGNQVKSVVTIPSGATQATRIDGFTIRNGGGTLSGSYRYGGGIYCSSASPTITNNTITGNIVSVSGGGIYCSGSSPTISRNTITGNGATGGNGGGIYCTSSSPVIANNVIASNIRAGICCSASSAPLIANNTITGNSDSGVLCSSSSPTIANNTIAGNVANDGGGINCYSSSATIVNTIIAFNSSGIYTSGTGSPSLRCNCVLGNTAYNYSGLTDPTGTNGNLAVDPKLASSAYGNVHIQPDSPCVDAGDDTVVGSGWTDIDGQPRTTGAHVDIGADESDGTAWPQGPHAIVRVSPAGNDANDGSSWDQARRTVQVGIDAAAVDGGEVWVAAGTYAERISLRPHAHVYGGFAATETQRAHRDFSNNATILDGGQGGSVVTATSLAPGLSTLDGFTIRNGKASNGGGISCVNASPMIANCVITGNSTTSSSGYGGGICCSGGSPTITNNTIAANTSYSNGGGIFCGSSATITHNTIVGNRGFTGLSGAGGGGGIYCGSAATIANNTISGNSAGQGHGGGIY